MISVFRKDVLGQAIYFIILHEKRMISPRISGSEWIQNGLDEDMLSYVGPRFRLCNSSQTLTKSKYCRQL